ncbi:MAG: signal transduction histidine kinase [Sphingobacteriales bacterium]|nr:signal transduction histidine kinase [Sphingobacteriales bacterium]
MHLDTKILFSFILLFSGLITLLVAGLMYKRLESNVRTFTYTMLAVAIWAIGDGLVLLSGNMEEMLFWTRFEYVGISMLPTLWITSVIKLIGKSEWLKTSYTAVLYIIPVITLSLVWTNESHHLYYSETFIDTSEGISFMAIKPGLWYRVHIIYFYFMLVLGFILLITQLKKSDSIYKKQRNIILIGILLPWGCNIIYLLGFSPFRYLDITPFTLVLTSLIVGFGLLNFRLFDIMPIARERIIEEMQEGLLVLNINNQIIDVNPQMIRILHPDKDIIGLPFYEVFKHEEALTNLANQHGNGTTEIYIKTDNTEKTYNVTVTSLFEKNTGYNGKFLLFKDISELYAKEAIRQLMSKKDEFISIASHELKTPVTSMKGYLQIIDKISQKEENPAYKNFIDKANKQVDKVVKLISDLLDISKIEAGKMQYNFVEFRVKDAIEDCISFSELNSPQHQIKLTGDCDLNIIGDQDRIEQVLCNLLSNAVKYAPHTTEIILDVRTENNYLRISVTDFGLGIAKDKQKNLFQKFSRLDNSNQISGLGIGLFLSHEIISRHGGTIGVDSEDGEGSTFYITLPFTAA